MKLFQFTLISLFTVLLSMTYCVTTAHGYGWGFKKSEDHQVPDVGKYKEILGDYGIYHDETNEKILYLTFDNGYEEGYTKQVLQVLREEKVPATFFVTGHYVTREPELVQQMVNEGHIIGNHSYHHPDFTKLSKDDVKEEIKSLEMAVANISDQKEMKYLRPPRGTFNEQTLRWAEEFGYIHVFWSLAFKDWETNNQKGSQYAYNQIMSQLHPGAILLLHTVSEDNAKALKKTIQAAKKQGYIFKSLDDLMLRKKLPKGFAETFF